MALPHFGAGLNLEEAIAPHIVESNGLRIALIGAVDPSSGPTQFASGDAWGVPSLDLERLGSQIRQLRSTVHHVIVSIHWGEERFQIPSPGQLDQARRLVDAGASLILGHHPHVLQGMEVYRGAPIIYSLGNFLADCVYYANGDTIRWNRVERTGCLLLTELTTDSVRVVEQIPTYDDGRKIHIDRSGFGDRQIRRINRAIERGVSESRYRRERFRIKTLRPTIDHLRPSKLIHLRPRHFRNALRTLWKP
jgi:poly-gamma-glutamate synthesis protein (capsule biosynthesis protein)